MNAVAITVDAVPRETTGAKIGMWLFLFTEIMLFGGLFLLYAVYRSKYPVEFHRASLELSTVIGSVNTVILLTSSLTMAFSISAVQKGHKTFSTVCLFLTIFMGLVFLADKGVEWTTKFSHGIYPGSNELLARSQGEVLFYGLYYVMTGLHALHVLAGGLLLSVSFGLLSSGKVTQTNYIVLENSGLYWHLVDVIWLFLFPLFYLIA